MMKSAVMLSLKEDVEDGPNYLGGKNFQFTEAPVNPEEHFFHLRFRFVIGDPL